jgi:hypothetical protein
VVEELAERDEPLVEASAAEHTGIGDECGIGALELQPAEDGVRIAVGRDRGHRGIGVRARREHGGDEVGDDAWIVVAGIHAGPRKF